MLDERRHGIVSGFVLTIGHGTFVRRLAWQFLGKLSLKMSLAQVPIEVGLVLADVVTVQALDSIWTFQSWSGGFNVLVTRGHVTRWSLVGRG